MRRLHEDKSHAIPTMIEAICKNDVKAAIHLTIIVSQIANDSSKKEEAIAVAQSLYGLDKAEIHDKDVLTFINTVCGDEIGTFLNTCIALKHGLITEQYIKSMIQFKKTFSQEEINANQKELVTYVTKKLTSSLFQDMKNRLQH